MSNDQPYTLTAGPYANFANIKDYWGQITQSFNNMAIEMWINEEEIADCDLDGCELLSIICFNVFQQESTMETNKGLFI